MTTERPADVQESARPVLTSVGNPRSATPPRAQSATPVSNVDGFRPDEEAPAATGRPEPTALTDRGSELAASGVLPLSFGRRTVSDENAQPTMPDRADAGASAAPGIDDASAAPDASRAQRVFISKLNQAPHLVDPHGSAKKHSDAHGTHIRVIANERFMPPSGESVIAFNDDRHSILPQTDVEREMKSATKRTVG